MRKELPSGITGFRPSLTTRGCGTNPHTADCAVSSTHGYPPPYKSRENLMPYSQSQRGLFVAMRWSLLGLSASLEVQVLIFKMSVEDSVGGNGTRFTSLHRRDWELIQRRILRLPEVGQTKGCQLPLQLGVKITNCSCKPSCISTL